MSTKIIIYRIFFILCSITALHAAPPFSTYIPSSTTQPAAQNNSKSKQTQVYKEGEVLVKYKKNISFSNVTANMSTLNIENTKVFQALSKRTGHTFVRIKSKTLSTKALLEELEGDSNVEYAEPNYIYTPDFMPNDPDFPLLWGENNTGQDVNGISGTSNADIDAPEAWDISKGSEDVVIAVIDSGVDYTHEDLAANMWVNPKETPNDGIDNDGNGYIDDIHGINAVNGSGDPMDKLIEDYGGHGTHMAGIIAAVGNNGTGVAGVSWKSKIMALKFLSYNGGTTGDVIECLNYMIAQKNAGVNIVASNNSWGGAPFSNFLKDTIKATNDAGILFVASAGNGGSDGVGDDNDATPRYPASYDLPGIISVAATDQDDHLTSFSNYGKTSVDLAAPGSNILSTTPPVYTPQQGDVFFDDLENGLGKWVSGGNKNTWDISDDQEDLKNVHFPVPSPTHFLSDSPSELYENKTDSYIMFAQDLDLSNQNENFYIGFGSAFAMEKLDGDHFLADHAFIEVSGDSGANWTKLFDMGKYITDELNARYWHSPYSLKIPDSFKTSHFRLRFHFTSDVTTRSVGWLIDNIGIGSNVEDYVYQDGTSVAVPHVSGAVALLASVYGGDTLSKRKGRILSSVDTLASLNSKVVSNGRLNLLNAIKTGICEDGFHHIQGTETCITDTTPDFTPPYLPNWTNEQLVQGTDDPNGNVVQKDLNLTLPIPTCPEGMQPEQGTENGCIPE